MRIELVPRPKIGETKQEICFAILPKIVDNHLIWFEKYIKEYVYAYYSNDYGVNETKWKLINQILFNSEK